MLRPVHFEIHASDPATVQAFYESVFGWRFQQWGDIPYWLVTTGDGDPMQGVPHTAPGVDGGLLPRQGPAPESGQPVNAFVMTVEVPDCDGYVEKALAAGGRVALPADDMPGVGRLAYVADPDGNLVGMLQAEPAPEAAPDDAPAQATAESVTTSEPI
jgi:predicted enzyme related to lactoylglutathione lyase